MEFSESDIDSSKDEQSSDDDFDDIVELGNYVKFDEFDDDGDDDGYNTD